MARKVLRGQELLHGILPRRHVSSRYSAKGLAELGPISLEVKPLSFEFLVAIARRVLRNEGGRGRGGGRVSSRYSAKGLAEQHTVKPDADGKRF